MHIAISIEFRKLKTNVRTHTHEIVHRYVYVYECAKWIARNNSAIICVSTSACVFVEYYRVSGYTRIITR